MSKDIIGKWLKDKENAEKMKIEYEKLIAWFNRNNSDKIIMIGSWNALIEDISLIFDDTIVITHNRGKIYIKADEVKYLKIDKKYKNILEFHQ